MLIHPSRRKKRMPITSDRNLGGALAAAIRIMFTKCIAFAIPPNLFYIFVTLVACYHDCGTRSVQSPNRIEDADCSHHIDVIRFTEYLISRPDHCLRGQMQVNVGIRLLHCRIQTRCIPDIAQMVCFKNGCYVGRLKMTRVSRTLERVTGDLGPQGMQPQCKPRPLEPGMAGQENPFAFVYPLFCKIHQSIHSSSL